MQVGATAFAKLQQIFPRLQAWTMTCFQTLRDSISKMFWISLASFQLGLTLPCFSKSPQATEIGTGDAVSTSAQEGASYSTEQVLLRAEAATLERDYAEAIKLLRAALKKHPGETTLQLELGRAYSAVGEDRKAEGLFREILAKEPGNRSAQLELARTLAYQRQYAPSDQVYRHLLSVNPADEAAAIGLTSNLLHEQRPGEAAAVVDAALGYHANSLRLLEFKDRIAENRLGGEERELPTTANALSAVADYIDDSAGNHSWRAAERLEVRVLPELTSDLRLEQDFLHGVDDRSEIVETFSEAVRWRPWERLAVVAGAGAIRFDNGEVRSLYDGTVIGQVVSHLVLGGGFSQVPIVPDAEAAEHRLTARGWGAFGIWSPAHWQINVRATRRQYSDGNAGAQESAEAVRQWNTARLDYSAGCRFRHYAFSQDVSHGYFSPNNYQSYQAELGVALHPGRRYRAEVTAYIGAESIAGGAPFQSAWEISFRNQMKFGSWDVSLDYFRCHMVQVTGAFRADGARFMLIRHF